MNKFLRSNNHYEIELTNRKEDSFSNTGPAPMAGQCDCDCSSDCACGGSPNMFPNRIQIEFTNRKKEMDRIIKTRNDIIVDAPAGFGKTYLLEKAVEKMSTMGWKAVYLDLVGPDHKPVKREILAKQLFKELGQVPVRKEAEATMQDLTRAFAGHDKIILFFDSLEDVDPGTLDWLRKDLIPGIRATVRNILRVIFSGRYIYNNAKAGEWNNYSLIKLAPLTPVNIQEVLERLTPKPPPDFWAGWIFWLSGGHPASIEAIINELDDFHWHLRLPLPASDLQERFQRRVRPYVDEVKKSVKRVLSQDMDPLWIFRVLDPEIIQYLQTEKLVESSESADQILANLSKARLITAGQYFYSDAVFQRLISISTEVIEPESFREHHSKALEIFNRKLAALYINRTPTVPLVEAHLSEIIYHCIQMATSESDLVHRLVDSLLILPANLLRCDMFCSALEREENIELDTKLHYLYNLTKADLGSKVTAELAAREKISLVESVTSQTDTIEESLLSVPGESAKPPEIYPNAVFVSYAWEPNSEKTVDELEKAFNIHRIHIGRDKKDMEYKGSIKEFEERIGRGACVILIISDKYLRSKHCMYELLLIHKNKNMRKRIFPIILSGAQIFEATDRAEYILFWQERVKELDAKIKEFEIMSNVTSLTAELDKFNDIRTKFDEFASMLSDMNALTPKDHAANDYSIMIDSVLKTLSAKGTSSRNGKTSP